MDSQAGRARRDQHACPVCGQPVDTVVRRHKTLGAWVPVWGAGPCHNPDCAASVESSAPAPAPAPAPGPQQPAQESAEENP
ncbi:hypothetical protein [Streptomyces sp. V3I7]|uniref:hypothetical protein n=1 Tax=Streptomyces sp. V3I7 TaxID=3042278 RepID=UPI002782EA34|nr:hypothetical protein [Streptomyces sp. V3I7]MDQ0992996.1 ribosomal protein L37AE/L43A [Streptomyces sp. V3I7]